MINQYTWSADINQYTSHDIGVHVNKQQLQHVDIHNNDTHIPTNIHIYIYIYIYTYIHI